MVTPYLIRGKNEKLVFMPFFCTLNHVSSKEKGYTASEIDDFLVEYFKNEERKENHPKNLYPNHDKTNAKKILKRLAKKRIFILEGDKPSYFAINTSDGKSFAAIIELFLIDKIFEKINFKKKYEESDYFKPTTKIFIKNINKVEYLLKYFKNPFCLSGNETEEKQYDLCKEIYLKCPELFVYILKASDEQLKVLNDLIEYTSKKINQNHFRLPRK